MTYEQKPPTGGESPAADAPAPDAAGKKETKKRRVGAPMRILSPEVQTRWLALSRVGEQRTRRACALLAGVSGATYADA
jgi:hypothetical protein